MLAYIVRRFALMLVTLFGVSVIIFVLLRIVPGNIADILFDAAGYVDPADKAQSAAGTRPRSADRRAIPALDRRSAARRSRLFLCVREAGARRDPAAHSDHRAARRPGAAVFNLDRRSARRHQRGAAELPARLCAARRQPERPVAAGVLARPADPDGVRWRCSARFRSINPNPQSFWRGCRDLLRAGGWRSASAARR